MHEQLEVPRRLGNCRLIRPIGRGGMGEVWLATMHGLAKPCVVKVLLPKYSANPEYRRRFHREARILAMLNHQRIVTIHDYGESKGWLYIVMDYVDGVDLGTFCRALRKNAVMVPVTVAVYIIGEILEALRHAHERKPGGKHKGVIHRDVTPGNVMISSHGEVYLTDFGLARRETELSSEIFGTLGFMAPEQAMGHACFQSDLFGVGGLLLFMLAGRPPRRAKNVAELLENLEAIDCATGREDVPEVVQRLMELCLVASPEERLAAAGDGILLLDKWSGYRKMSTVTAALYRNNVGPEKTGLTGVHEVASEVDAVDPKGGTIRVEPAARLEEPRADPEPSAELPERTVVLDWQPGKRGGTERAGTGPSHPANAAGEPVRPSGTVRLHGPPVGTPEDLGSERSPESTMELDRNLAADPAVESSPKPATAEAAPIWKPWWNGPAEDVEASDDPDDDTTRRFLPPSDRAEPDAPRIFRRPRRRFAAPPDGALVGSPVEASSRSSSPIPGSDTTRDEDDGMAPCPPESEPAEAAECDACSDDGAQRPRTRGGRDARALVMVAVFMGLGLVVAMALSVISVEGHDAAAEAVPEAGAASPPAGVRSQTAPEVGTHARALP